MRDYGPVATRSLQHVISVVTEVFKLHGAEAIQTPIVELGVNIEGDQVFRLETNPRKETLALRYDLTLPFARYLAQHGINKLKRYQVGTVYRMDTPQMTLGRYREFHQCDFDIVGEVHGMVAEIECICVVLQVFERLGIDVHVKISHRQLIKELLLVCGVAGDDEPSRTDERVSTSAILSAIDGVDKLGWRAVGRKLRDLGLPETIVVNLMVTFNTRFPLGADDTGTGSPEIRDLVDKYLGQFIGHLQLLGLCENVSVDCSMVRGLHYYTGFIFEVVPCCAVGHGEPPTGSIVGGGRYDNLTLRFADHPTSAVGFSLGLERIVYLCSSESVPPALRPIHVITIGATLFPQRLSIAHRLWQAGLPAQFSYTANAFGAQLKYAHKKNASHCVILGPQEYKAKQYQIKCMDSKAVYQVEDPIKWLLCRRPDETK